MYFYNLGNVVLNVQKYSPSKRIFVRLCSALDDLDMPVSTSIVIRLPSSINMAMLLAFLW